MTDREYVQRSDSTNLVSWCPDHCEAFKSRTGGGENGTAHRVEELTARITTLQEKSCIKSHLI